MLAQRAVGDSPRWTRAVEDQSAPIPEEKTSELGGIICSLAQRPQSNQAWVSFRERETQGGCEISRFSRVGREVV